MRKLCGSYGDGNICLICAAFFVKKGENMTTKQKLAASKLQETAGNVSKAMKLAGYSDASAKDPQRLTRSKGWQELMEKYLPDKRLLKVHKGLLENKDWRARDAGLDKAYKVKGKYVDTKVQIGASEELEKVLDKVSRLLP